MYIMKTMSFLSQWKICGMALFFVLRRDLASGEHQRLVPRPAQEVAPRGEVQLCSRRGANAEALQNACHEDKQLRLGEVLADADAVAKAKGLECSTGRTQSVLLRSS